MKLRTEAVADVGPRPARSETEANASSRWVDETICRVVREQFAALAGADVRAVVLTGSMARGEATIVEADAWNRVRGDAEFLVICDDAKKLPAPAFMSHLGEQINRELAEVKISCRICLSAVSTGYLRRITPHIFGYELRCCGKVIWGDPDVLALIPHFTAHDIPREDALRILCNRILECLEVACGLPVEPRQLQYALAKLYLDMATSFLVFRGAYRPSYRERLEQVRKLARQSPQEQSSQEQSWPFAKEDFSQKLDWATHVKLSADTIRHSSSEDQGLLKAAVRDAHDLWRWELMQLLAVDSETPDHTLFALWAKSQSGSSRARGWARVLRDASWQERWRNGIRWVLLGGRWTPRHAVYAASCQLFFCLPDLQRVSACNGHADLSRLEALLPVKPLTNSASQGWRSLAAAVALNYHRFLETTRT